jgi:guanylate kinase
VARLFVVSGPSGVGKSTILRELVRRVPGLSFAVSHTTRPRRGGEVNGRDYHFVSDEEFDRLVEADAFVEWAVVHLHRYGTSKEALRAGGDGDLLIEVDVQGADALREQVPEAVTIFIEPPAFRDLKARLTGRGRESGSELEKRLQTATGEMERAASYDHRITNDQVHETVNRLAQLVHNLQT